MLQFKHLTRDHTDQVATHLAESILSHLAKGEAVLWLVPGGSSIPIAVAAAEQIAQHPHAKLTVSLTDERFDPLNHPDSNWYQLEKLGFTLPEASLFPVLKGKDGASTTLEFAAFIDTKLNQADFKIGFFGVGADGHTAGIIPGSSAVEAKELAHLHTTAEFERLTITPPVIRRLDEAVIFACGEEKWPTLAKLTETHPLTEQPAQVLKQLPLATLYTDFPGAL